VGKQHEAMIRSENCEYLVTAFRQKLPAFFNCSKVLLWIRDPFKNEVWTQTADQTLWLKATKDHEELIIESMNSGKEIVLRNRQQIISHSSYKQAIENEFYRDEERRNLFIVPVIYE
jgi:transcriptional regulator with GAF, ATPase, and Fis domain